MTVECRATNCDDEFYKGSNIKTRRNMHLSVRPAAVNAMVKE